MCTVHAPISRNGKRVVCVNAEGNIFEREGLEGQWSQIEGNLSDIAVSSCSEWLVGTHSSNSVWYKKGCEHWKTMDGEFKCTS